MCARVRVRACVRVCLCVCVCVCACARALSLFLFCFVGLFTKAVFRPALDLSGSGLFSTLRVHFTSEYFSWGLFLGLHHSEDYVTVKDCAAEGVRGGGGVEGGFLKGQKQKH